MTQTTTGDRAGIDRKATVAQTAGIMAEASAAPVPFHERSEFKEIYAKLTFISLGIAAMKGIGSMMQPGINEMNAGIHEASYVFEFFGEALEAPAQEVYDTLEQLQWAAKREAA